jgi:hypothetical protein
MEMDFNHYYRDFMGVYGYENRKWKMDGPKLIRYSEDGTELYFYDLPDFNKAGLVAWFNGLRGFNLVNNKTIIPLNLYQRWKLYSLIEDKFNEIQRLNRVKKQMVSVSETIGRGAKAVAKGLINPVEAIDNVINKRDQDFYDVRDTWRDKSVSEHEKAMKNATKRSGKVSAFQLQLEERQKAAIKAFEVLEERGNQVKKSAFQERLEQKAQELRDRSISKEDLMDRNARIQERITKLQERFNNG